MELFLVLVLLVAFGFVVAGPLRPRGGTAEPTAEQLGAEDLRSQLSELEARRRARYREIRDAQSDRASGKLSAEDFERLDAELRSEAVQVLDEIAQVRTRLGLAAERPPEVPPRAAG